MTQIEEIKAEIKRRIKQFKEERNKIPSATPKSLEESDFGIISLGARIAALEEILVFINSLSEDKSNENLDEEIKKYFAKVDLKETSFSDIANHFAQWQKEQTINKACDWLRRCIDVDNEVKMIDGEPDAKSFIQKNIYRIKVANQIVEDFKKAMDSEK